MKPKSALVRTALLDTEAMSGSVGRRSPYMLAHVSCVHAAACAASPAVVPASTAEEIIQLLLSGH